MPRATEKEKKIGKKKETFTEKNPDRKTIFRKKGKRWIILERKMKYIQRERKKPNEKQYL